MANEPQHLCVDFRSFWFDQIKEERGLAGLTDMHNPDRRIVPIGNALHLQSRELHSVSIVEDRIHWMRRIAILFAPAVRKRCASGIVVPALGNGTARQSHPTQVQTAPSAEVC